MPDSVTAGVRSSVEIYPFEQGPFTLTPGQILGVSVHIPLRGSGGTFTLQLAPGGPVGTESPVTWSEIITPLSLIVIGLARGADAAVTLVGVVTGISEAQSWPQGGRSGGVSRGITVTGGDFSWFFETFNWYALSFYGLTAGTAVGNALNFVPATLATVLSQGAIGGNSMASSNPTVVGRTWYKIMAGADGILNRTFLPYQSGARILFGDLVGQVWENYPDVYIPYADYFMISEESWSAKFKNICAFPWYEFFIVTAPENAYTIPGGAGTTVTGTRLSMASLPGAAPAGPQLVARVNPVPALDINADLSFAAIDTSRWNALPLRDFTAAPFGFLQSSISFFADTARNFYQLNPTGYSTITSNNSNNIPFAFQFIAAGDPASVQRYGFRPQIGTTRWLFDPQGNAAQNPGTKVEQTILSLTGRMLSWHHPTPLMASASVTLPLSPTILVGTRFRYRPFKSGEPWDFYIEDVSHTYEFGGTSSTRLLLSRGLPQAVYADAGREGLLQAVHTGNAMRQDGKYVKGLPDGSSAALTVVTTTAQASELSGKLSSVFVTPQAGAS